MLTALAAMCQDFAELQRKLESATAEHVFTAMCMFHQRLGILVYILTGLIQGRNNACCLMLFFSAAPVCITASTRSA